MAGQIIFSGHAVRQMFERGISKEDVVAVLTTGKEIAAYPEDQPYPSRLLFALVNGRPLHLVVADDQASPPMQYIITAYEPSLTIWMPDFQTRRPS